jgi:hypothetical protein
VNEFVAKEMVLVGESPRSSRIDRDVLETVHAGGLKPRGWYWEAR